MTKFFADKNLFKTNKIILFSEFSEKSKSSDWRELTLKENQRIQYANFLEVKEEKDKLLGRNGSKIQETTATLNKILTLIKKKPLLNASAVCK